MLHSQNVEYCFSGLLCYIKEYPVRSYTKSIHTHYSGLQFFRKEKGIGLFTKKLEFLYNAFGSGFLKFF